MSFQGTNGRSPSADIDDRGRSQFVFIAVGLAIIIGGLWILYDSSGPYHPQLPLSENETYLPAES